ncbi:hypothetical protein F1B92_05250 [Campylobacter sp. FMV-PI01]|uniref:Uncharacterized protein n=1 Tax=Campylobacter portucalensis TaxID=2608384 RepID=A0A6L5WI39_9BACT|nr:hypothetical protein [Campylobacter portucalensis]MSN96576.1 hypothetical protein [Campylobacter portucalensis]
MLSISKAPKVASTILNLMFNKLANLDEQDTKFHKALETIGIGASYLKITLKKDVNLAVQEF